ncbi:unnamed protein product [Rangifer tarandus platyrhynchus]|uniref:Uncharacterized protein n=2 Tax=Rangifer tarandus platyrhynchus TaxID=3082113 RepID=A0ACB0DXD5_RANTA|nr:unnamed protein product [Rangifer tarandus platyrhynchus]CAI9692907.1 unnamed protein product [Rangifer tarandus platyrhynchus]
MARGARTGRPRIMRSGGWGSPGATVGARGGFCQSEGPVASPQTKAPATRPSPELRGRGRTRVLTFPGGAVRGSAPLRGKRSVEPGLCGLDCAGHSIFVQRIGCAFYAGSCEARTAGGPS